MMDMLHCWLKTKNLVTWWRVSSHRRLCQALARNTAVASCAAGFAANRCSTGKHSCSSCRSSDNNRLFRQQVRSEGAGSERQAQLNLEGFASSEALLGREDQEQNWVVEDTHRRVGDELRLVRDVQCSRDQWNQSSRGGPESQSLWWK